MRRNPVINHGYMVPLCKPAQNGTTKKNQCAECATTKIQWTCHYKGFAKSWLADGILCCIYTKDIHGPEFKSDLEYLTQYDAVPPAKIEKLKEMIKIKGL